jgi:mannosyltransferase
MNHEVRLTRLAIAGILAVAAALRLVHANADFWFDEIVTVQLYVRPPIVDTMSTYIANNHVLNSILAHVAVSQWGEAPWVVRLPAIAFGIAGVWAFWLVAGQVWPRVPALLGTLLFAVSYYDIYYTQNARGYSAFLFFALLATALLLKLFRKSPGERPWILEAAYTLAIGLGLYSMLLQIFIVAGQATVLMASRRWRLLGWLTAGCCLAAILYSPMAGSLISYYRMHPSYTGFPILSLAFARSLASVAAVLIVGGLVAMPLVVRLARRRIDAAALILAPAAFNVLLPLIRGQGVYPRTFIFGLGVGYFLLIEGLDYLFSRQQLAMWLMAAVVGAVSVAQLVPYYLLPKQGFKQAVAYVDANRAPADQRIGLTLAGKAVRFYDPSIALIENTDQILATTRGSASPAWIISTFPGQMQSEDPELYRWLQRETLPKAVFPGVIGDGTVRVSYWTPALNR